MNKFILKITVALAVVVLAAGCEKDFDEINKNPNAPTSVSPALLLPQVIRDMANTLVGEGWGIGNIVIQHTAKNQFVNEDRYIWTQINSIWDNGYANLRDVYNIINQSEELDRQNYVAVGLVLKSWMFSLITDAYGDVPYSEAIQGKEGVFFTNYDTQEAIYNGMLADLARANTLFGSTPEKVEGDVLYSGDLVKWRKLCNSLRIRMLMRISKKRDVSADLRAIVDNPTANPIFTANADHAVYTYRAAAPDQFPVFTYREGSFNEFRASKTLLDTLQRLQDSRLSIFFRPTPATIGTPNEVYAGIPNGLADVEALQYNGGPQNHSRIGPYFFELATSAQGLQIAKSIVMTYAELQFLLAEAAEKGLITADAETHYKNGVNASFAFYGITTPAGYFDLPQVIYTGSSTEKLNKIGFQKWIALFFNGLEAWFDWRRTGIPALQPAVDNQTNGVIPVRFPYPQIEQALNLQGYDAAVARQGADEITTKMWLLK